MSINKFLLLIYLSTFSLISVSQESELNPSALTGVNDSTMLGFKIKDAVPEGQARIIYTSRKNCIVILAYLDDIAYSDNWVEEASDEEISSAVNVEIDPLKGCSSPQALSEPKLTNETAKYLDSSASDSIEYHGKVLNLARVLEIPSESKIEAMIYLGSQYLTFEVDCAYIVTRIDYFIDSSTQFYYTSTSTTVIPSAAAGNCMVA